MFDFELFAGQCVDSTGSVSVTYEQQAVVEKVAYVKIEEATLAAQ